MDVVHFSDRWPWFGRHSGYGQLTRYLAPQCASLDVVSGQRDLRARLQGSLLAASRRQWRRLGSAHPATEAHFERFALTHPASLFHLLYADIHHAWLTRWPVSRGPLIGTLHHPPVEHRQASLREHLRRLPHALVLYQRDLAGFEEWVGRGRVHFVRHGVDVDFFRPLDRPSAGPRRVLFVGVQGRDRPRLVRLARQLLKRPGVHLDLVVPKLWQQASSLRLEPRIHWHYRVDDAALRDLYQRCHVLLLPLRSAGANNALVEALASGLPVVTNDVGGSPDYGAGAVFPLPEDSSDEAMLALLDRHFDDPDWSEEVGQRCRAFAVQQLAWPRIAREHLAIYERVLGRS